MARSITIYSGNNDGYIFNSGSNWVTVRDADSGSSFNKTATSYPYAARASAASGRGGTTYFITRSFFEFDVSGITHMPASAKLSIRGVSYGNADVVAVKGRQSASLGMGDFDAIDGWDGGHADGSGAGNNSSNVTLYGAELSTWSTSGYNHFTILSPGLIDIAKESLFKVCLLENDNDVKDITATSNTNYSGLRFSEYTGTSSDPALVVEEQDNAAFFGCNF